MNHLTEPFNIFYKIYYYYDLLNNINFHSYEKINNYKNNDIKYICSFETGINYIVNLIKECILRQFSDMTKIKIKVEKYDKNNNFHIFLQNVQEKIYYQNNDINKNNDTKIDFTQSIFINVYDENNKIFFIGTILY